MSAKASYHHGDLPAALLAAVDEIVREGDAAALTLREVARRAGVSHAAPAHHFGDKAGLLTAFATQGFAMLRDRLAAAVGEQPPAADRAMLQIGLSYVGFAIDEPGRFTVMFRRQALHAEDPGLVAAREGAYGALADAISRVRRDLDRDGPEVRMAATGAWSIVHGFATLWLEGAFSEQVSSRSPTEAAEDALVQFGATLLRSMEANETRGRAADA